MAATKYNLQNFYPPIKENGGVAEVPHLLASTKNTAVTFSAGSSTKTVTDTRIKTDSIIILMPTSTNPDGHWYVSTRTAGTSFVVTSSSTEPADVIFEYLIL